MGAVVLHRDLLRGRRRALREAARDLGAEQVEKVEELLSRWDDQAREELVRLLGAERARRLLDWLGIV